MEEIKEIKEIEENEEYQECLGCGGEYIPNYSRVDHSVSWIFEEDDILRPKDAYRFCCANCRRDFRSRNEVIAIPGYGKRVSSQSYKRSRNHFDSPLMRLERMFDLDICVICLALGGANIKPRNKALCGYHMSQEPVGYRCGIYKLTDGKVKCGYRIKGKEGEGKRCKFHPQVKLEPYWNPLPEGLEFLKGKKKLSKWVYAQLSQSRGKDRGLEILDQVGDKLEIGNGSMILNLVEVAEMISKGAIK